jgi:leucyl-tRNA synthetase
VKRYNPKDIEPKWQQQWEQDKIYLAEDTSEKPKKYILEYFPYPSGAAMHVGHVRNYAIGDAMARFHRMRGYNVLHPMGWDAFGLPAENFAIKTGISPQQAILQNTTRFKQQLTQMGFGYDWSREVNSSDPDYYKWTQWLFLLLHKRGLAYRKESNQWWCPVDKTVLANEQVEDGKCWRCGSVVEKKALPQWFFRITDYADRLAADLDNVDWTDSIKNMQRNWIGRSSGAEIDFKVTDSDETIKVFTTRPDTIFGVTFMVIAPEHPLLKKIVTDGQRAAVEVYSKEIQSKSDVERQETNREKTGVFTGAYAINPMNGERVPVWTADYVLYGYGTGAIMAVPAHDERDHAFAKKFDLPMIPVVTPMFRDYDPETKDRKTVVIVAHDPAQDKYCLMQWKKGHLFYPQGPCWPGGGVDEGETLEQGAAREFSEESGYTDVTITKMLPAATSTYYNDHAISHQRSVRFIALATVNSMQKSDVFTGDDYEKDAYDIVWLTKDEVLAQTHQDYEWRTIAEYALNETIHVGEGSMVNSGPYDNLRTEEARERIVADLETQGTGKGRINYKIRDWLISRQRYWGAPIPMIHCEKDGTVPVPEDQLPVVLPELTSFEPSGDGRSPLGRVEDWVNTTCPTCGGPAQRETDTMDGFACSSWYFLRYADPHNKDRAFDDDKAKYWLPVDDYIGGAEHAVMHLLYARMWTKVMHDEGLIDFDEPFTTLRNHGMILAPDGAKMSKSKGNTIEPDALIEQGYGADSIRIMELFIGPWNQAANWSVEGMGGAFRFLQRIWALTQEYLEYDRDTAAVAQADDIELKRTMHRAIHRVSKDMDDMGFNTAIAGMMETVNELYKHKVNIPYAAAPQTWEWSVATLLQLLAPFAPHITEELWHQLGREGSIHTSEWPVHDEQYLVSDTMVIVAQVNGKVRAQIEVPTGTSKEQVIDAVTSNERVAQYLKDATPKKVIYVPGKLVNFVV